MESGLIESVEVAGRRFDFSLCRKSERFGPVEVDHWWMPITDLYQQRQRRGHDLNHRQVIDCFWAMVLNDGPDPERDVRESYLLARLVPHVRSQGSRTVFLDAWPYSLEMRFTERRLEEYEELQDLLSSGGRMSRQAFHESVRGILRTSGHTPESRECYREISDTVLSEARVLVTSDAERAFETARHCWDEFMRGVSRRAGRLTEKLALDVISYECRAALHRCYSAAWCLLLPWLRERHRLSEESFEFLQAWHLEPSREIPDTDEYFHLFHGHVFGLHPIGAMILRTRAGRERVGEWLSAGGDEAAFERVLFALNVAAFHYQGCLDRTANERRQRAVSTDPGLIDHLHSDEFALDEVLSGD